MFSRRIRRNSSKLTLRSLMKEDVQGLALACVNVPACTQICQLLKRVAVRQLHVRQLCRCGDLSDDPGSRLSDG